MSSRPRRSAPYSCSRTCGILAVDNPIGGDRLRLRPPESTPQTARVSAAREHPKLKKPLPEWHLEEALCGLPGRIRTPDLLIRSQPLCPSELRAVAVRRAVSCAARPIHATVFGKIRPKPFSQSVQARNVRRSSECTCSEVPTEEPSAPISMLLTQYPTRLDVLHKPTSETPDLPDDAAPDDRPDAS